MAICLSVAVRMVLYQLFSGNSENNTRFRARGGWTAANNMNNTQAGKASQIRRDACSGDNH